MNGNDFLAAELSRLAFLDGYEAGLDGMLACAYVIRNRVNAGWGSWDQVLTKHQQWSWRLQVPNYYIIPSPNNHAFMMLLQEANRIYDGSSEDRITVSQDGIRNYISVGPSAPPALYYGKLNEVSSDFFQNNICGHPESHRVIASVHPLTFFT